MLAVGQAAGAIEQGPVGVALLAAVLVGGCYAFMRSALRARATAEVVPEARATVVPFFAAGLFVGSGVAAAAAAPLVRAGSFGLLFASAVLISVPLALEASLARCAYDDHANATAGGNEQTEGSST